METSKILLPTTIVLFHLEGIIRWLSMPYREKNQRIMGFAHGEPTAEAGWVQEPSVGRESGVRGSVPKNRSDVGSPLFQPIPDHTSYLEPIHVRTQEK
ncbi:hypothetical protein HCH54_005234 [Aspergillus fumigatus]